MSGRTCLAAKNLEKINHKQANSRHFVVERALWDNNFVPKHLVKRSNTVS